GTEIAVQIAVGQKEERLRIRAGEPLFLNAVDVEVIAAVNMQPILLFKSPQSAGSFRGKLQIRSVSAIDGEGELKCTIALFPGLVGQGGQGQRPSNMDREVENATDD